MVAGERDSDHRMMAFVRQGQRSKTGRYFPTNVYPGATQYRAYEKAQAEHDVKSSGCIPRTRHPAEVVLADLLRGATWTSRPRTRR